MGDTQLTAYTFDDETLWRDYDVLSALHHRGKLYIFISLEPRKKDANGNRAPNTYRLCLIEGERARTIADCEAADSVTMAGDNFIQLSRDTKKLSLLNLTSRSWQHWHFPWFVGEDDIEPQLHISDGCIFVSQKGGNTHANRDLLYVIG